MTPPDITQRARQVVRDVFIERPWDLADLKPETTFASLDFDSLDTIELVIGLEDAFEIEVPDADVEELKTVGDAVDYLAKVLGVPTE